MGQRLDYFLLFLSLFFLNIVYYAHITRKATACVRREPTKEKEKMISTHVRNEEEHIFKKIGGPEKKTNETNKQAPVSHFFLLKEEKRKQKKN